jgi:predicted HD phosphohydrolase
MVLVRDRRTEQREDAVAGRLHDIAVVVTHCLDHEMQCGIDDRAGFFGIEVLHQLGRTLDIREQRRHRLALTLESR